MTTGNWLHASVTGIHDYDNFATTGTNAITGVHYQWRSNDILTGTWISIFGANKADFLVTPFYKGALGMRVQVNYVDGKNYTEQLNSDATTGVSPGRTQHAADSWSRERSSTASRTRLRC